MQPTQLFIDLGLALAVALTAVMMVSAAASLITPFLPQHDRPKTASAGSHQPVRSQETLGPNHEVNGPTLNVTPLFPGSRIPVEFAAETPQPKRAA